MTKRPEIPVEEFIRVWQRSPSGKAAAEKLGMDPLAASVRASRLRARGVPLKRMRKPGVQLDIPKLAALVGKYKR